MTIEVVVTDEQSDFAVDAARWAALAKSALVAEHVPENAELSLLFVEEAEIAALNERYLQKTGPTDVLSFPLEDDPRQHDVDSSGSSPDVPLLLGDIVICPSVAARNAPEHAGTFEDEIALLVVHGVLHVLGHDHEDDSEAELMEAREQELLRAFFANESSR
jgi:probable rRNA maturation factor